MNLQETDLGKEGKEYVSSCLDQETGLCSKLLAGLNRGGTVFAPIPATTPSERARQFETGGLMSRRETYLWFERHLELLSGRTANGSLVFQDVWAQPRDFVEKRRNGLFFDQTSVYYVLGPGEINATAISLAERAITSFQLVAVFCDFSFRSTDVPPTRIVPETIIDQIANSTQEIFLSAYDQEGLVVWRRKD